MTRRTIRSAALAALAVILVAGACGDDGEDGDDAVATSTTTTTAPSGGDRQAYLDEANDICGAAFATLEDLPPDPTPDEVAVSLQQTAVVFRSTVVQLRALVPPAGEEATFTELFGRVDAMADQIEEAAQLAAAQDQPGFAAAGDALDAAVADLNADFEAVGLSTCAS